MYPELPFYSVSRTWIGIRMGLEILAGSAFGSRSEMGEFFLRNKGLLYIDTKVNSSVALTGIFAQIKY